MKFKIIVNDFKGFKQAITTCKSGVYWHTKENKVIITPAILTKIEELYKNNHGIVELWIETRTPSDYFKLIYTTL